MDQYGYGYPPPPPVAPRRSNATLAIVLGAAGLVVVLAAVAVIWVLVSSRPSASHGVWAVRPVGSPSAGASAEPCRFTAVPADPDHKIVGVPDVTGSRRSGPVTMTITTNLGVIEIRMDAAKTPCTIASFAFLAGRHFFDNSTCHRLVNQDRFGVLQCGDPTGTGRGGPAYQFPDENLTGVPKHRVPAAGSSTGVAPGLPAPQPSADVADQPYYPRGTVAMANSGPDTNGSQFFLVFRDTDLPPAYTPFGQVTRGLEILDQVAAGGDDGALADSAGGGHPKTRIVIQSLAVT